MREAGFYWVKYDNQWTIMHYNGMWNGVIDSEEMDEIDERRITRQPEPGFRLKGEDLYLKMKKVELEKIDYQPEKDSGLGNKLFGLI